MSDSEKFAGFKQRMIEENEKKYGREIREKYGDEESISPIKFRYSQEE